MGKEKGKEIQRGKERDRERDGRWEWGKTNNRKQQKTGDKKNTKHPEAKIRTRRKKRLGLCTSVNG